MPYSPGSNNFNIRTTTAHKKTSNNFTDAVSTFTLLCQCGLIIDLRIWGKCGYFSNCAKSLL